MGGDFFRDVKAPILLKVNDSCAPKCLQWFWKIPFLQHIQAIWQMWQMHNNYADFLGIRDWVCWILSFWTKYDVTQSILNRQQQPMIYIRNPCRAHWKKFQSHSKSQVWKLGKSGHGHYILRLCKMHLCIQKARRQCIRGWISLLIPTAYMLMPRIEHFYELTVSTSGRLSTLPLM